MPVGQGPSRSDLGRSMRCLWCLGWAFVIGVVCSCSPKADPAASDTATTCGRSCRRLPDSRPGPYADCVASADCGERANTQRMMCIAGGVCETVCSGNWADCNKEYRDGCEAPSEDGRCPGDADAPSDPLASVNCMRESEQTEPYDCDLFWEAADAASVLLAKCYHVVHRAQPGVESALTYRVTIAADGRPREIVLRHADESAPALEKCANEALGALRLRSGPHVYPVKVVFTAGTEK